MIMVGVRAMQSRAAWHVWRVEQSLPDCPRKHSHWHVLSFVRFTLLALPLQDRSSTGPAEGAVLEARVAKVAVERGAFQLSYAPQERSVVAHTTEFSSQHVTSDLRRHFLLYSFFF